MNKSILFLSFIIIAGLISCNSNERINKEAKEFNMQNTNTEVVAFGAGCFWCVEAVFERLNGVVSVTSGYQGGDGGKPTYEDVCTGTTGFAEVCEIIYQPDIISFEELLEVFWKTHDPTTLNRQGADIGSQYRSVIFYHNKEQKIIAEEYKSKLNEAHVFNKPIVTEISEATRFYEAEKYHQDYYENNPGQAYCSFTIAPKIRKLESIFKDKLKK